MNQQEYDALSPEEKNAFIAGLSSEELRNFLKTSRPTHPRAMMMARTISAPSGESMFEVPWSIGDFIGRIILTLLLPIFGPIIFILALSGSGNRGSATACLGVALISFYAWWQFFNFGTNGFRYSSTNYEVLYKVMGTAEHASMTYEDANGTAQETIKSLPWEHAVTLKSGAFAYLSAQADDNGDLTATILVNNNLFKQTSSSGFASIADVHGTLP